MLIFLYKNLLELISYLAAKFYYNFFKIYGGTELNLSIYLEYIKANQNKLVIYCLLSRTSLLQLFLNG